jgi:ABC-2 type transport system ATP-binding protein
MMAVEEAIRVSGLVKRYGEVEALRGLDLAVPKGTIFGVIGPNGAGKTTFIKVVCGLAKPAAGSAGVLGFDADRKRWKVRERIGYMPQEPALYEDLSPRQNLRFFGGAYGARELGRRISETLEFLQLSERADDPVYEFSGGMKQRVSLGCALVHEPELLLLDEPTAGVDPQLRWQFWKHFESLKRAGKTILVSTHQMDELMHCDRVAILQSGELLAEGSPQEILALGGAVVRVEVEDGAVVERSLRDYEHELPELLRDTGIERVKGVEVERATLEEIMLELTERRS